MPTTAKSEPLSPDFWLGVFAPALIVGLLAPLIILRAWVMSVVWGWYVVPAFGVAPLRVVYAFGLSLLATEIIGRRKTTDDRKWYQTLTEAIVLPLITLGLAWLGTFFL